MANGVPDFMEDNSQLSDVDLRGTFAQIGPKGGFDVFSMFQNGIVEPAQFGDALRGITARYFALVLLLKTKNTLDFSFEIRVDGGGNMHGGHSKLMWLKGTILRQQRFLKITRILK